MIVRTPVERGYTVIPNATLEDSRLSWKARGILSYLLTKPDRWEVMVAHLVKAAPDGRDSVMSGLRELRDAGYIVRHDQTRSDSGQFDSARTEVRDMPEGGWPNSQVTPQTENPTADEPCTGEPLTENPTRVKTHSASKEEAIPERDSPATPSAPLVPLNGQVTQPVDTLCRLLADRVQEHQEGKRPPITKAWERDMDLLLRRGPLHQDKPEALPPDRVARAIEALFTVLAERGRDGFCWADQIRSPGALRDHWLQLATAVRRLNHRPPPRHHDGDDRSLEQLVASAMGGGA